MKRNNLYKLVSGSILMLLPLMVQAQIALKNWTIEDHSGEVKIIVSGDTLEITAPKGLTLWYNQRLTGDYEICYRVKMLMQGGKYDRLSDLNCFWGANTTRFRQYFAKAANTSDAIARPVIKEYTDKSHLLFPNKWYDIQIRVEKGITTYRINGEELFRLTIKDNEGDGHFGLRLLENHTLFTNFQVKSLKKK